MVAGAVPLAHGGPTNAFVVTQEPRHRWPGRLVIPWQERGSMTVESAGIEPARADLIGRSRTTPTPGALGMLPGGSFVSGVTLVLPGRAGQAAARV